MAWLIVEIAVDIGFVPLHRCIPGGSRPGPKMQFDMYIHICTYVCRCVGVWACGCGRESTDTVKVDLLILCEYQVTWHCALLCTSNSTVLPYL